MLFCNQASYSGSRTVVMYCLAGELFADYVISLHVQAYYSGERNNSPVYSLAGTSHYMHVALDMGLFFVDFAIR